jgi:hypothetical protein
VTSISPKSQVHDDSREQTPTRRRGWLWALVVVVVTLVGASITVYTLMPGSSDTQTESFDGRVDRLVIHVTGSVTLVGGDRTELTISREWLFSGEPAITTSQDDETVRVIGECSWFEFWCTTTVTGTVAQDAAIEVTASAGSIHVSGTTGGVDLETSAGSIEAEDVTGQARLVSSAGNITGKVTDGNVEAQTSAGRIDLTVLGDFSRLAGTTNAGNIALVVTDDVYNVDADTSAGSVSINVRDDPSAPRHIVAESSAGSITISPEP